MSPAKSKQTGLEFFAVVTFLYSTNPIVKNLACPVKVKRKENARISICHQSIVYLPQTKKHMQCLNWKKMYILRNICVDFLGQQHILKSWDASHVFPV